MAGRRWSQASLVLLVVVLAAALLGDVAQAFQPRSSSQQGMRSRALLQRRPPTVMGSSSTEGNTPEQEPQPQEGHRPSVWKAMRTKFSVGTENVGKLVFGTGAAMVAGFGAPQTVDLMKGALCCYACVALAGRRWCIPFLSFIA